MYKKKKYIIVKLYFKHEKLSSVSSENDFPILFGQKRYEHLILSTVFLPLWSWRFIKCFFAFLDYVPRQICFSELVTSANIYKQIFVTICEKMNFTDMVNSFIFT